MIVIDFYIARTDLFRRPNESKSEHTIRVTAVMNKQWDAIKASADANSTDGFEAIEVIQTDWPAWLEKLIRALPRRSWGEWFSNFWRGIHGERPKIERVRYDAENRVFKVFFDTEAEVRKAVGWRTSETREVLDSNGDPVMRDGKPVREFIPDVPGRFQKAFAKAIERDPGKKAWAVNNRLQISSLIEVNEDVLASDGDLLDYQREVSA